MKTIRTGGYIFAVVDDISPGYAIWNVSIDMPDGYLLLCRLKMIQPFEGGQEVDTVALQAIKIADAKKYFSEEDIEKARRNYNDYKSTRI